MSENCHPKTIHLVWLFLAVERQHSTRLAQAIHLKKEAIFTHYSEVSAELNLQALGAPD